MITFGSFAARLRGDLPPWRHGAVRDIDLFTTRAEATAIGLRLGRLVIQRGARAAVVAPNKMTVDCSLHAGEVSDEIGRLPDNGEGEVHGFPVVVVSALTDRIIKRAVCGVAPEYIFAKHRLDADFYKSLGATITPAHVAFFRFYRRRSIEAWRGHQ